MKKTTTLLIILTIIQTTSALQDAYITIDSKFLNLCIADYENPTTKACDNQTLTIEGTRDHSLIITPYADTIDFKDHNATVRQFLNKPPVWISAAGAAILSFAFIAIFFALFILMIKYLVPK